MTMHRSDERGVSAIETLISFSLILVLILAVLQGGLFLDAKLAAQSVANDAAGVARRYESSAAISQAAGESQLDDLTRGILTTSDVEVTRTAREVDVTIIGTVHSVVPGLRWQFRQTAGGPVERFVEPSAP